MLDYVECVAMRAVTAGVDVVAVIIVGVAVVVL